VILLSIVLFSPVFPGIAEELTEVCTNVDAPTADQGGPSGYRNRGRCWVACS